jgi:pro-sigmaK processing inhibitor BofA
LSDIEPAYFKYQIRGVYNYLTLTGQGGLMDAMSAIQLLVVAILVLIVFYVLLKLGVRFAKYLAINSIIGIIVLVIANIILANFGLTVPIGDPVTILICALAGIPGALLVILLVVLGIA